MKPEVCDPSLVRALAAFRYQIRGFLQASESAAHEAGLQPQQHQLLLQLAGAPAETTPTIAHLAERLGLRHNSTVELVDRCVAQGLVARNRDRHDRRHVVLAITPHGASLLDQLSAFHARELYDLAPALLRTLRSIGRLSARPERKQPPR